MTEKRPLNLCFFFHGPLFSSSPPLLLFRMLLSPISSSFVGDNNIQETELSRHRMNGSKTLGSRAYITRHRLRTYIKEANSFSFYISDAISVP